MMAVIEYDLRGCPESPSRRHAHQLVVQKIILPLSSIFNPLAFDQSRCHRNANNYVIYSVMGRCCINQKMSVNGLSVFIQDTLTDSGIPSDVNRFNTRTGFVS
jgi:hypothetical protein